MNQAEGSTVYRIHAVNEHRWDVSKGSSPEPVASFAERHAALVYAMTLARRATSTGRQPFSPRLDLLSSLFSLVGGTRGTRA